MLTTNIHRKLRSDFLSSWKSLMPSDRPMPMIGPISGETNMAPIMTAVELTFSPSDAMNVAQINTQRLVPRNSTLLVMLATTSACVALSSPRSNRSRILPKKRPSAVR